MTTEIKPLYAPFAALLTILADQGEAPSAVFGADRRIVRRLQYLLDLGYVSHRRDHSAPRLRYLYAITEAGLAALGQGITRAANPRFTAVAPPFKPTITVSVNSCIHHYIIANDFNQTATCKHCRKTKEFRPTFTRELLPIGTGTVEASERFPARVGA